jgi:hypothetical protein
MRALRDQGGLKYSALNLTAIQKFGTLEYRALQGTVEPHTIQAWVNILLAIKELAKEIGTINNLAELFDQEQLRSRLPIRFTTAPPPPSWYEAGALSLSILSLLEEEPVEVPPPAPFQPIAELRRSNAEWISPPPPPLPINPEHTFLRE